MMIRAPKQVSLFVLAFLCLVLLSSCTPESSLTFDCGGFKSPLLALNSNARKAVIYRPDSRPYAYFSFSDEQLSRVEILSETWEVASFMVEVLPFEGNDETTTTGNFAFGFLYEDDFEADGKLRKSLSERPLVRGQVSAGSVPLRVAMALRSDEMERVRGIVVHSTAPLSVAAFCMVPGQLGFDFSGAVSSYYFGPDGGNVSGDGQILTANFLGAEKLFGAADRRGSQRPVIALSLVDLDSQPASPATQPRMELDIGGESIFIRRTLGQRLVTLHCAALNTPYSVVRPVTHEEQVVAILMRYAQTDDGQQGRVLEPLVTDPGMIPLWSMETWRTADYELFEWEQFPGLIFFDTANYGVQDDFFKRLAFFTEKTGYVGTLVSDRELAGKHGFNAHDYRAETLASFFSLAQALKFRLNQKEILLRDILVHNGIIVPAPDGAEPGYLPGYGGVISLSQDNAMYLRYQFIAHEGLHGLYFVDEPFREKVADVFDAADADSIRFLLRYFQIQPSLNYNLEDTYLVQNEFMAYLLQQPVSRTGPYFAENLAWRGSMLRAEPDLSAYVRDTNGAGFTSASQQLSEYIFSRWGMEAGRVSLVSR